MIKSLVFGALLIPTFVFAGDVKNTLILHEEAIEAYIATYQDFWMGEISESKFSPATAGNDFALTSKVQFVDKDNDRIFVRSCTTQFKMVSRQPQVTQTSCESPY